MSLMCMGEEHLLASKVYGHVIKYTKRELGMDMREAYRQKDLMCRKIAVKRSMKADMVRLCCHTIIQFGEVTFYDMAEIDSLKYPDLARQVSRDFSAMTNTILSNSSFYKDHEI